MSNSILRTGKWLREKLRPTSLNIGILFFGLCGASVLLGMAAGEVAIRFFTVGRYSLTDLFPESTNSRSRSTQGTGEEIGPDKIVVLGPPDIHVGKPV